MSTGKPGQAAYEGYAAALFEAHDASPGDDAPGWPSWDLLPETGRHAWEAAAQAAVARYTGLDVESDEMRPGELDAVLAAVPPCEAIAPWGMRCRVVRTHEMHRDRDGNMWQPAPPGSLRAALEAALADWRDDAKYRPTDTRDEMSEHVGVTACADTLAGILVDHPEPQPAPGLAAADGDVHVDWHMTPQEWGALSFVLGQHADTPYIARLINAGKVPAPADCLASHCPPPGRECDFPDCSPARQPQPAPGLAAATAGRDKARSALLAEILGSFIAFGRHAQFRRCVLGEEEFTGWRERAGLKPDTEAADRKAGDS